MIRTVAAAAAALVLAACNSSPPPVAPVNEADSAAASGNQIAALPEGSRNGVFIRAIRDANQDCQHVDSSEPAAPQRGNPAWTAHCDNGATYTIVLTGNGGATVVNGAVAPAPGAAANTQ
ncbi:hypothetical protein GCM10023232_20170 [Sphingosinicella ginsenosidimutans]|uniref:Uncharacterized protein n=1 Tax=Allosphingosinicella ginsenosidimutans TaxID=1176539 RepID=A0A5C6TTL9_9SPHN|nr:hypothetical protein [Sphingosinicella ginsenosidimutans]TXC63038.1 hypothetical protein FRZ32_04770 [Sphingosinicella ginsenosidimutans]